jgi:hypothetical protein
MEDKTLGEQEVHEIAVEAYLYFYPLITMDLTRRVSTNSPAGQKPGMGPMNMFHHARAFPDPSFREVVRPNFDTLYSLAWLDLGAEPVIVSAPNTKGRYYLLPMLDMWTDVFAVPGKRTSGTQAGQWAVTPPGFRGSLPQGVARIAAPTRYVWIIGRTFTGGKKDFAAVHEVQDGFQITPLSGWGQKARPVAFTPDQTVDMHTPPLLQVNNLPADKFFAYAAELLQHNPPHLTDWSLITRLQRIGIAPGQRFELAKASPSVQRAFERAAADGMAIMKAKLPTLARVVNGWQMNTDTVGVYGNYYLKRAIVAMVGLGANQPQDAIYPLNIADAEGKPLDGKNPYVMHFDKDELPPVDAFWSLTMYDAAGFPVENSLNRYSLGDRDSLTYNPDGSLDVYLQHDSPGASKEANWLPTPTGPLGLTMRLYAPRLAALDGRWAPPVVKRV